MPTLPRHRRRVLAVLVSAGAAVAVLPGTPAQAAANTSPACPKSSTALAFTSTLSNGVTKLGKSASITGSTAAACGLFVSKNGALNAVIKPANVQFAPVTTVITTPLGPLSLPTTLTATSQLVGPVKFTAKGQTATLSGKVLATADIYGQKCNIPLTVRLTTGKSGSLTGTPFAFGSDGVANGQLVDNTVAVPKIEMSATCNLVIATLSNALLGLPLAAGDSTITYSATLKFG